ncbi:MAG: aminotransferase class I/II-fold pyridoxal phosphate-dependent enzyme [Acidobacteria bacterium]|nr:aminotransferase class I/II-fold pyridoxal phosphate-dependent enzyme [Acidobacteriota bacterium]
MKTKTQCVRGDAKPAEIGSPIAPVIVPGCTYDFENQEAIDRFFQDGSGYLYSRYDNPTVAQAGRELAALEGAESAAMFSSGMAAMSTAILTFAVPGRRIVTQVDVYGGTTELMNTVLPGWGFEVETLTRDELHALDPGRLRGAAVLCLETPTNPALRLVDLTAVAKIAREADVPTIVDSTFASPMIQRPTELGIDLVMHSATKYLGGHGDLVGGAIAGSSELVARIAARRRILGGVMDAFSAFLLIRGLRTLAVRVEAHQAAAMEIARFLDVQPAVESVAYPGLPDHPDHALAKTQMDGFGGMISFCVRGDTAAAKRVHDRLRLFHRAGSLGSVESLVSMPARMSHRHVPREDLEAMGIPERLLRLSVGLESPADLIADLDQALAGSRVS